MIEGIVFDIEADGLLDSITKIHCLSINDGRSRHTTSYDNMRKFFTEAELLVGHNIVRYDVPALEKILAIKINAKLVDTLALSWYLYPENKIHGLEWWGEYFGVPKPVVKDWVGLSVEEYINRCNEDVKINKLLWEKQWLYLNEIYDGNEEKIWGLIHYLSFKMDCAREQERSGWKLDVDRTRGALEELTRDQATKLEQLTEAMPRVDIKAVKTKPAKPFKKDGTLSVAGAGWFNLLNERGLPATYDGEVETIVSSVAGNPNSHVQVKDWLYSLGWVPQTFKYKRDKETGDVKSIPQINLEHGAGICPSVSKLYAHDPNLELLEGLGVLQHRIGILNGFLRDVSSDGYVQAAIAGFTNTLRVKHATVVNLPKVGKAYGDVIRGVLIAPEGWELCGSDMASLEDRLKQHYIYPYDPDYVNEMNTEGYDPHLSLAVMAKEISHEAMMAYIDGTDKSIKPIRDIFKNGNYACQYGAMPKRLSLTADISLAEAKKVWKAYWDKNWAIKKVAEDQYVKTVNGQMWLLNPISGFFYSLRFEKDRFSTLVQGSAAYVFDLWLMEIRKKRSQLTATFHDELVLCIKKADGVREKCTKLLQEAITTVNKQLKLNRELGVEVQYGSRYSDIH